MRGGSRGAQRTSARMIAVDDRGIEFARRELRRAVNLVWTIKGLFVAIEKIVGEDSAEARRVAEYGEELAHEAIQSIMLALLRLSGCEEL